MTEKRFPRTQALLAQFVIIVAGVLVALAADQWRGARSDRATEARYLERLRADLQWDTANFAAFDRVALRAKAEVLRDLAAENALVRLMARESLVDDLNYSGFVALPANRPATFEELQSTGNLGLIRDIELRGALSYYYSGFDHISRVLTRPFGDYRSRLESSLSGTEFYDWRIAGAEPDSAELRRGLQRLIADSGLPGAVNAELAYTAGMTFYLRQYYRQAVELLERLDDR